MTGVLHDATMAVQKNDRALPKDDFSCQRQCSYSPSSRSRESQVSHTTQSDQYTPHKHHYGSSSSDRLPTRDRRPDLEYEHRTRYARSPSPRPQYRTSSYHRHSSPSTPPHSQSSPRSPTRHVHFSQSHKVTAPFSPHRGNE